MKKLLLATLLFLSSMVYAKDITLTSTNTVNIVGPIDEESVGLAMSDLQKLYSLNTKDPIYVVVNSPGGSVEDGLALIEFMKSGPRPVYTIAHSMAASMGFHILQAGKERYMTQYTTIMSHRVSGGVRGFIPQQMYSRFTHGAQLGDVLDKDVLKRNKKFSAEEYAELIRDEYWAVGERVVEDGFADSLVKINCDKSLSGFDTKTIQVFIFSTSVKISKCPLVTQPILDPNASALVKDEVFKYFNDIKGK